MPIFDLEAAHRLLPRVEATTARAARLVDDVVERASALLPDAKEHEVLEREVRRIVEDWAQEITQLGALPKGVWLVDFDNGEGYWCWSYPEPTIDHYHGYNEGAAGRRPIVPAIVH